MSPVLWIPLATIVGIVVIWFVKEVFSFLFSLIFSAMVKDFKWHKGSKGKK